MGTRDAIKLYEPIGIDILKQHERFLGFALFKLSDRKVGDMEFWVDDYGHIHFIDIGHILAEEPVPCFVKDSKSARKIAEMFMTKANKNVEEYFKNRKIDFPRLFPPSKNVSIKPPSINPVIHPKNNQIDHWLCRYYLLLKPSFHETLVPVFNAEIQIRIGGSGSVYGLYYMWRPIVQSRSAKRYNLIIETPTSTKNPLLASTSNDVHSSIQGKTYNPDRTSEPPQLAYYCEEGNSFVAPYYLGFSSENQIFIPASEFSKSIYPSVDFAPPYDKLKHIFEKLLGIKFPELPSDNRLIADWRAMYLCWFFETTPNLKGATWTSDVEVEFDYSSPYSEDIRNSVSMKEIKDKFLAAGMNRPNPYGPKPFNGKATGFQFTGPASGIPNYYSWVEWFVGSYDVTINWSEISTNKFDVDIIISNKSGWFSGTRLPKSWQDKIKSVTGIDITNLVDDAPRGETIKRKLHPIIVNALESLGVEIPSFGGNFWQYFHIKDTWEN